MKRKTWMGPALALGLLFPAASRAEVDKKIERLWKAKCASCHGADGKGQTEQGQKMGISDLTNAKWQEAQTDTQIKKAITDGVNKEEGGKKKEMDAFKDKLTPEQADALVAYVRTLK